MTFIALFCLDFSSNEEVKFFRLEKLADYWLVLQLALLLLL